MSERKRERNFAMHKLAVLLACNIKQQIHDEQVILKALTPNTELTKTVTIRGMTDDKFA